MEIKLKPFQNYINLWNKGFFLVRRDMWQRDNSDFRILFQILELFKQKHLNSKTLLNSARITGSVNNQGLCHITFTASCSIYNPTETGPIFTATNSLYQKDDDIGHNVYRLVLEYDRQFPPIQTLHCDRESLLYWQIKSWTYLVFTGKFKCYLSNTI